MQYKLETIVVGQGVMKKTNRKLEEAVQPILDKRGSKRVEITFLYNTI